MPKPRLAVDVDGVLADQTSAAVKAANDRWGLTMTPAEIVEWRNPIGDTDLSTFMSELLRTPGFIMSMPVMPGAVEAMKVLDQDWEIVITTHRGKSMSAATQNWLVNNDIPFVEYHAIHGGKGQIDAVMLIDDYFGNVEDFIHKHQDGLALLFDRPYNRAYQPSKGIVRVKDWTNAVYNIYKMSAKYLQK